MQTWRELLETNNDQLDYTRAVTYVICCQNKDTLNQFLSQCWKIEENEMVTNLEPLGFFTKDIGSEDERLTVNVYYVRSPLSVQLLKYLKVFGEDIDLAEARWVWLMDWIRDDKRHWLRNMATSVAALAEVGLEVPPGGSVAVMLSPSHVLQLERNTMLWNSRRLDMVHQSIRAACLKSKSSLVTFDPDDAPELDTRAVRSLIQNTLYKKDPEMASLHDLFIPYGTDSVGKICTISPEFPVDAVFDEEFIAGTFEATITAGRDPIATLNSPDQHSEASYWSFDLQKRLAQLYKQQDCSSKSHASTHHRFHKLQTEDYNYQFKLPENIPAVRDRSMPRSPVADSPHHDTLESV
ncbi:HFR109Cp [Eremothecium sinecaudum]|uniref:HFR109Cp n=1 Tax=Eremothecium sinecaudum TaxID=45286 RepID=A0A0X8HUY6_9SACH|nr:HFR109Cp [Eremothecium sinecaudum]AMD21964.1 HFR109Cp [Eremothecium sinecaudum]